MFDKVPKMDDVFNGIASIKPTTMDSLYATVSAMSIYARDVKNDAVKIGYSLAYAQKFPSDFRALLLENYKAIDKDYEEFLRSIPEYYDLAKQGGVLRNGSVD